jgi:hypothetical protein
MDSDTVSGVLIPQKRGQKGNLLSVRGLFWYYFPANCRKMSDLNVLFVCFSMTFPKIAWHRYRYSIPLSILIGIPLYSNAAGIVPIVAVLIEKGASLGTSLAFMMSVIGLSLPEVIILRKVLQLPLIFTFIGLVGSGIMVVGYLFNYIF